jgi:hypothetical protein
MADPNATSMLTFQYDPTSEEFGPAQPRGQYRYYASTRRRVLGKERTIGLARNPLGGAMKEFWEGRPELMTGGTFDRDWLNLNRPGVPRYEGRYPEDRTKYTAGRGAVPQRDYSEYPTGDQHDISGFASDPRPYAARGTEFDGVTGPGSGVETFPGHRLRNVRVGQMAGEEIGPQPALGMRQGHDLSNVRTQVEPVAAVGPPSGGFVARPGAAAPGEQFRRSTWPGVSGGAFGELPAAGGSSYTYTTNNKGQMGWDF